MGSHILLTGLLFTLLHPRVKIPKSEGASEATQSTCLSTQIPLKYPTRDGRSHPASPGSHMPSGQHDLTTAPNDCLVMHSKCNHSSVGNTRSCHPTTRNSLRQCLPSLSVLHSGIFYSVSLQRLVSQPGFYLCFVFKQT